MKAKKVSFRIQETVLKLKKKYSESIEAFLRCNPDYEGYVFVPKSNGAILTGAFIAEEELGNPRLITNPADVRYYKKETGKFYQVFHQEAV